MIEDILYLTRRSVEKRNGNYVIKIPEEQVEQGQVPVESPVKVALMRDNGQQAPQGKRRPSQERGGHSPQSQQGGSAPVQKGEVVEAKVESVGAEGDGMFKIDGFVVFVENADKGETVEAKITKVKANQAFAELEQVIEKRQARNQH
jgi:predicted RNA-binding protein with TRAM domain